MGARRGARIGSRSTSNHQIHLNQFYCLKYSVVRYITFCLTCLAYPGQLTKMSFSLICFSSNHLYDVVGHCSVLDLQRKRASIPEKSKEFSLLRSVRSGSGIHPIQYRAIFPPWLSGRGMKLTAHLHLVPRLRMSKTIPSLPHTSSWRGA
jgi:hypothetical protein